MHDELTKVDIEKMQMFLPKTKNINDLYYKRLSLTYIPNLNNTINTERSNKSNYSIKR